MRWFTASKENNKKISKKPKSKLKLTLFEMTLFSMFGALIFGSKVMMEFLPNIHLVGMFTVLLTIVYRMKALIPLYIFVMLNGLIAGFSLWWVPYLYIWTILWGITMLVPKKLPTSVAVVLYPLLCSFHGFIYGALYAPFQALIYGFTWEQTMAWIVAGFTFDLVHGIANFVVGLLIYPLSKVLRKLTDSVALRIA